MSGGDPSGPKYVRGVPRGVPVGSDVTFDLGYSQKTNFEIFFFESEKFFFFSLRQSAVVPKSILSSTSVKEVHYELVSVFQSRKGLALI